MVNRREADSKKLKRLQAKHAKNLEAKQQAQKARDLAEAEHEASMAARDSGGRNCIQILLGVTCKYYLNAIVVEEFIVEWGALTQRI